MSQSSRNVDIAKIVGIAGVAGSVIVAFCHSASASSCSDAFAPRELIVTQRDLRAVQNTGIAKLSDLLPPGVKLKADFSVSLAAQNAVVVEGKALKRLPDTRVESVGFYQQEGSGLHLALATQNDTALRLIELNPTKKSAATKPTTKKFQYFQSDEGGTWSARIEMIASDSSYLITSGGPTPMTIFDLRAKKVLQKISPKNLNGKNSSNAMVIPLNHFPQFFLTLTQDGAIQLWSRNSSSGKFLESAPVALAGLDKAEITASAMDPSNASFWVAASDELIRQFPLPRADEATLLPRRTIRIPGGAYIASLDVDAKGGRLILGTEEYRKRVSAEKRWDVDPRTSGVMAFDLVNNGILFANTEVHIGSKINDFYVVRNGSIVSILSDPESSVRFFAPDGRLMTSWDVERDPNKHHLSNSSGPNDPIHSSALSPDGRHLAVGTDGGNLMLFDAQYGLLIATTYVGSGDIRGLAFSPSGSQIAVGAHLGVAKIYELQDLIGANSAYNEFQQLVVTSELPQSE